jgi:hypothetical protein
MTQFQLVSYAVQQPVALLPLIFLSAICRLPSVRGGFGFGIDEGQKAELDKHTFFISLSPHLIPRKMLQLVRVIRGVWTVNSL